MNPSPLTPGSPSRWIWPFEILEQIGEGGMGVVYRARYVVNNRHVALKMLPVDIQDKTALARFERELDVLKTIRHQNVVRCFGGACEDKRRFYAMELMERGTLENELQRRTKFPWEEVVEYGLQICAALECSHNHKVIHRDVKPSNFLIAQDGTLKLSDFGLASVVSASRITASGKTAGTFLYMAPEQIRGKEVTPRTDLYALGCVLFELVTGEVPFHGETAGATLHMHCTETPRRPSQIVLECPLKLELIILKLLEKDPADRYQSAAEVAQELRNLQTESIVLQKNELGSNYPTGYQRTLEATPAPDRRVSKKPAAERQIEPRQQAHQVDQIWPRRFAILSVVLGLSLLLTAILLWKNAGQALWRTAWIEATSSRQTTVRDEAWLTIGRMAREHSSELSLLESRLGDPDPAVRTAVLKGLSESGATAKSLIPKIINIQKNDEDEFVRTTAGMAVLAIQSAPPVRGNALRYLLPMVLFVFTLGATTYGIWIYLKSQMD